MRLRRVDLFLARAGAESFYREFAPAEDLREFVACTWMRVVRTANTGASDAILPDGCADIMVVGENPPFIAGPDAVTRWVEPRDGAVITGIRLRPGACRAVLGSPAEEIVNGGARLSDIAHGGADLHQRLLMAETAGTRLALLEGWVREALAREDDRAVVAACRLITQLAEIDIGSVADKFDWNVRTIHRRFLSACGYSPKHFQRIMRVQRALQIADRRVRPSPVRLGELASAAGYADQAHMTRDFRDITGFTPAGYFASVANPGWGAWISEDW